MVKLACWNIYFSHKLIDAGKRGFHVPRQQKGRPENVLGVVRAINADVLGIVECMARAKLRHLARRHLPGTSASSRGIRAA